MTENKEVIAERNKRLGIVLLIMSVVLIALCSWRISFNVSFFDMFALIVGVGLLGLAGYMLLSPTVAIVREGDSLIFYFIFRQRKVKLSDVEYVSYHEVGFFASGNGSFFRLYRIHNDIRRITVTVKEETGLRHFTFFSINNASAVKASIDASVEIFKKNKE